ncbi:uncharacterized protein, partial [Antedon mediterranea]|uniref:uncharacterized protein n=1 Tax=Antedon mediterranea TaxID=105859 RepID=UPI003AF590DC
FTCLVSFFVSDVLSSGVWSEFEADSNISNNEYLSGLVSSLKESVLASKAGSTTSKYSGGWKRWKVFAVQFKLQVFQVKPTELALYIEHLKFSASSVSPINSAIYSIRWAHNLAGISPPTDSNFLKSAIEGSRRKLAKRRSLKAPISSEVLSTLVAAKGSLSASVIDLRLLFICLVSFSGMLRCDEVINLRLRDISIFKDHMAVFIAKRKNDQFREGHSVFIARSGKPTCPVAMAERYIAALGVSSPSHPLICGFRRSKSHGLKPTAKAICYTTARDLILAGLSQYVDDPKALGTHSLRAGGATEAASTGSVNERCITRQGGWKSSTSKDMYVKDSLSNRLSVSRAMKL